MGDTGTVEQALSVSLSDTIRDFNSLGYEFLQRDALHTVVTLSVQVRERAIVVHCN